MTTMADHLLLGPENLKKARKEAGYTQEQAAKLLSISVQSLRGYEQGSITPPVPKIREMARLYGVSFII